MKGLVYMDDIRELLKLAVDSMKRKTLNTLLEKDSVYQEIYKEQEDAYQDYVDLEMSEEQREVVDALLTKKYELTFELQENVYMAGLLDGYRVLKSFNLVLE